MRHASDRLGNDDIETAMAVSKLTVEGRFMDADDLILNDLKSTALASTLTGDLASAMAARRLLLVENKPQDALDAVSRIRFDYTRLDLHGTLNRGEGIFDPAIRPQYIRPVPRATPSA